MWLYSLLYLGTDHGADIERAQWIFGALYLVFIATLFGIYLSVIESLTRSKGTHEGVDAVASSRWQRVAPMLLVLLCASRRIHSIFVLRLFNDCWAMLFVYLSIWCLCKRRYSLASFLFSVALSIKMNVLLFLPPLLLILTKAQGLAGLIGHALIMISWQVSISLTHTLTSLAHLSLYSLLLLTKGISIGDCVDCGRPAILAR